MVNPSSKVVEGERSPYPTVVKDVKIQYNEVVYFFIDVPIFGVASSPVSVIHPPSSSPR
jgi:hypothetical protein